MCWALALLILSKNMRKWVKKNKMRLEIILLFVIIIDILIVGITDAIKKLIQNYRKKKFDEWQFQRKLTHNKKETIRFFLTQ